MKKLLAAAFLFVLFSCKKETADSVAPVVDSIVQRLDTGLVAFYPFTGNTADSSTFKNHGTGTNVTLTTDHNNVPNRACYFSGNNSFVKIPHSASLDLKTEWSVSCWVKPDTNVLSYGQHSFLVYYGDPQAGMDPYFLLYDVSLKSIGIAEFYNTGSDVNLLMMPTTYQFKNVWVHTTATFNNTTRTFNLYLNGIKVASQQFSATDIKYATTSAFETYLGSAFGMYSFFKGALDEVRIYNRELSAVEAWTLYKIR